MTHIRIIVAIMFASLIFIPAKTGFADVTFPGQQPRRAVSWHDPTSCAGVVLQCVISVRNQIDTCGKYVDNPLYRLIGKEEEAYWAGKREYTYCREKFYFPFQKELILIEPYVILSLPFVGVAFVGFLIRYLVRRRKK